MCFSSPSIPSPPPPPPAPPEPAKPADKQVQQARDDEVKRARALSGASGSILTGGQGLGGTTAPTAGKSLLGQ